MCITTGCLGKFIGGRSLIAPVTGLQIFNFSELGCVETLMQRRPPLPVTRNSLHRSASGKPILSVESEGSLLHFCEIRSNPSQCHLRSAGSMKNDVGVNFPSTRKWWDRGCRKDDLLMMSPNDLLTTRNWKTLCNVIQATTLSRRSSVRTPQSPWLSTSVLLTCSGQSVGQVSQQGELHWLPSLEGSWLSTEAGPFGTVKTGASLSGGVIATVLVRNMQLQRINLLNLAKMKKTWQMFAKKCIILSIRKLRIGHARVGTRHEPLPVLQTLRKLWIYLVACTLRHSAARNNNHATEFLEIESVCTYTPTHVHATGIRRKFVKA